ncbi:MAG: hypothetical protein Q9167_004927 [Letrouitia subvulpina]
MCSGYRDPEQVRIRDETQSTEQRALKQGLEPVSPPLSVNIDDQARNAFYAYHVSGTARTFDVIAHVYNQDPSNERLNASIEAVSLAFFNKFYLNSVTCGALDKYQLALRLLDRSLRSCHYVTEDSTLLSVLLLDLVEKMNSDDPLSAKGWMSHINGALALFKLRKTERCQDSVGLRLAVRLSTNLMISCVLSGSPLPPDLIQLRSDIEPLMKGDPKWQASGLVVKYGQLGSALQEGSLSSSDIITRATELDHELLLLTKLMPASWLYRTKNLPEISDRTLEQHYTIYPNTAVTQTWNLIRIMRIYLNRNIREHLLAETAPLSRFFHSASSDVSIKTIDSLAREVCASIPQYTTLRPPSQIKFTIETLRCHTVIFPLYVAGLYGSNTAEWVIKQLKYISDEVGIRAAKDAVDMLEKRQDRNLSVVFARLGSYTFAAC